MEDILSREQVFNSSMEDIYSLDKEIDFELILKYASKKEFIPEEYVFEVINAYKNAAISNATETLVVDKSTDIEAYIKRETKKSLNYLNQYCYDSTNLFKTVETLLSSDPKVVLKGIVNEYDLIKESTIKRINDIRVKDKYLEDNHDGYKKFVKALLDNVMGISEIIYYPLMNETFKKPAGANVSFKGTSTSAEPFQFSYINYLLDKLENENSILSKFDRKEVLRLIKSFGIIHAYRNICETALFNYIFNAFYKEGSSIVLSDKMIDVVNNDITNNLFDTDDVIDIINNGDIEFSNSDKEYIYKEFIPLFKEEVVNSKYKDLVLKIR